VNNCAAVEKTKSEKDLPTEYNNSGGIALDGSRSFVFRLKKASQSLPDHPAAPVSKSERMKAQEAPCIRTTHDSATMPNKKGIKMKPWKDITHYAGLDWARDHHAVVIVDQTGKIVSEFEYLHSLEGWKTFSEKTSAFANLAVVIETNQGIVVDQLLQRNYTVYPINPVAAESYRKRKVPSGTKTDFFDAWSLAEGLRMDGQNWNCLQPLDELTIQLRLLCRDEIALIENRTQLVNQLQQALVEYYPAALEAFNDWTAPSAWDFIIEFSTPESLVKAGKRRWEKFLHTHKLWRPDTTADRLEIFARADKFQGSPATIKAKGLMALSLCKLLRTLQQQLDEYRRQIETLFESHPGHDLFGSLPGAKKVLAPRLLAGIGTDPDRYGNKAAILQAFAGTAPISFQSGQISKVKIRWACDKFLRHTVHLWADCFRHVSAWGDVYYKNKRKAGMSHACALRCLGQRLLKIVFAMIVSKTPYDAELHARNQQKHGSWILKLIEKPTAA
jgi:transposase